jgi:hypothetical protein
MTEKQREPSEQHLVQELDGAWHIAASGSLIEVVEQGAQPEAPQPGGPPPGEVIAWAEKPRERAPSGYRGGVYQVPTCWEREIFPKGFEGPVWFVRHFSVDEVIRAAGRVRLEFSAVSYYATVWLNGTRLGEHRGMWDPFSFDVTKRLEQENVLAVEVYKPWELFPVRKSLAGFIPYVTTTFGGIWQSVRLLGEAQLCVAELFARLEHVGQTEKLVVTGHLEGVSAAADIDVRAGDETASVRANSEFRVELNAATLPRWSPENPETVAVTVRASANGEQVERTVHTGLRIVGSDGRLITLNHSPVYPRGVLHWLSYPELIAPTPDEATIRHEIVEAQKLGYTMIKLCLVIPPERYFRIADEMGMMLWLELPMWLPKVDDHYRDQAKAEYRRILRRVRNHPSIVMYTLGCELSSEADAAFLRELYDIVKEETGASLVRDNSGSAECYGGVDLEFADYHDYHFYAEATSFTGLLDYFAPAWKPIKPLVFGEYCDSDTFRSVAEVKDEAGHDLYWSHDDPVINPQGVRWDYNVVTNEERLASLDIGVPSSELSRRSRAKSMEYRKWVIEQTRIHPVTSGYVVTNIQDTPITTSGMLDDFGRSKFDAGSFRFFNAETVVAVERDKRRVWQRGADRPQHQDAHVFASGEQFRVNAIIAHGGTPVTGAELSWRLELSGREIARGVEAGLRLDPRRPVLAANPTAQLPAVERPARLSLMSEVYVSGRRIAENRHEFWVVPDAAVPWEKLLVVDERGLFQQDMMRAGQAAQEGLLRLEELETLARRASDRHVIVSTLWSPALLQVAAGRPVIFLLDATTNQLTSELPFFREGIPLVHEHPVVDGLPHDGYAGAMWGGVTPDRALIPEELEGLGFGPPVPVISRLDARTAVLTHYATEIRSDTATVLLTTLGVAGSFGRTPVGLRRNVLGRYLLTRMVEYVSAPGRKRSDPDGSSHVF